MKGGGIYLNGQRDYLSRRVKAGDIIQIKFFDEKTAMEPEDIPLKIVYEDAYLLIVNKDAGMAVHPTGAYQQERLANACTIIGTRSDSTRRCVWSIESTRTHRD